MGQPKERHDGARVFHVNFHTIHNRPIFQVPEYHEHILQAITEILDRWSIPCLAWQVMPTHLHFMILTFADQSLGRAMDLIKGASARMMLAHAPELRPELGDHLW